MGNVINGGDLMLFIDGKSVAFATSHKLTINVETVETTSKDNGGKWVSKLARKISWTASTDNLYSDTTTGLTFNDLFTKMVARKPIKAVFALEGDSTNLEENKLDTVPEAGWKPKAANGYEGNVIITSLDANASNGDNATFTASFEGVGELKAVTA